MASIKGRYVTAHVPKLGYPLQGWAIRVRPLRIRCTDGEEHDCTGKPKVVINPPRRAAFRVVQAPSGKSKVTVKVQRKLRPVR